MYRVTQKDWIWEPTIINKTASIASLIYTKVLWDWPPSTSLRGSPRRRFCRKRMEKRNSEPIFQNIDYHIIKLEQSLKKKCKLTLLKHARTRGTPSLGPSMPGMKSIRGPIQLKGLTIVNSKPFSAPSAANNPISVRQKSRHENWTYTKVKQIKKRNSSP